MNKNRHRSVQQPVFIAAMITIPLTAQTNVVGLVNFEQYFLSRPKHPSLDLGGLGYR
jgi:hypothetical protein